MRDFNTRLNKVITEIKNIKTTQTIGGDSWVVYRTEIDVTLAPNSEYKVIFSPITNNEFVAVCKLTDPERVLAGEMRDLVPDPNINGVWWRPAYSPSTMGLARTIFVYSTVKGSVSVQDVTGQDAGSLS